ALPVIAEEDLFESGSVGDLVWISQSAVVSIHLAGPNSAADLLLFDDAGKKIASKSVSGGPATIRVAVSNLAAELALPRAELRVNAGRATAAAELTDNVSGDLMIYAASGSQNRNSDITLAGVAHGPQSDAGYLDSDIRLVNMDTKQSMIIINFQNKLATVMLEPHSMQEIRGALGTVFGADDGARGPIRFRSGTLGPV